MLPDSSQKAYLLQAIAEIDRSGVPVRQQSRRYDLFYKGKAYPPKLVVRTAQKLAAGTGFPTLTNIREINDFLSRQGFTIVLKPAVLPQEEEPAIEHSEWVLQRLLNYRETHPDFYFLTRSNQKRDLLEAGQWVPGTDYLHVALTVNKNDDPGRSVGFQIDYSRPEHPRAAFVISFQRERRPGIRTFYRALLERLAPQGMRVEKPDYFVLDYGENVLEAMNLFLERDVPVFQALLHDFDLKDTLGIGPKRFTHKPANILEVKEEGVKYKKSRLARLCWNTNGWVLPSGTTGKSEDVNTLEARFGFSPEEWLLDLDKILSDGYHYGFLQPVHQEWPVHTGKQYAIRLYTLYEPDRQYYWIGELRTVEIIDKTKAKAVEQVYKRKGWLQVMGEQLAWFGLDAAPLLQRKEIGALFNVRFLPEDVYIYPDFIPFSSLEATEVGEQDYAFLKTPASFNTAITTAGFKFRAAAPSANMPENIVRKFQHRTVEHPYLHGRIQQGLYKWLKEEHGAAQVANEQGTGVGGSRIDLAVRNGPGDYTFYEIKTFNSLMICIRVAIGQLMEYAFYPEGSQADRLVIVSYHRPEKSALLYLENIRQRTGLSVYYGYFDLESGDLEM